VGTLGESLSIFLLNSGATLKGRHDKNELLARTNGEAGKLLKSIFSQHEELFLETGEEPSLHKIIRLKRPIKISKTVTRDKIYKAVNVVAGTGLTALDIAFAIKDDSAFQTLLELGADRTKGLLDKGSYGSEILYGIELCDKNTPSE